MVCVLAVCLATTLSSPTFGGGGGSGGLNLGSLLQSKLGGGGGGGGGQASVVRVNKFICTFEGSVCLRHRGKMTYVWCSKGIERDRTLLTCKASIFFTFIYCFMHTVLLFTRFFVTVCRKFLETAKPFPSIIRKLIPSVTWISHAKCRFCRYTMLMEAVAAIAVVVEATVVVVAMAVALQPLI